MAERLAGKSALVTGAASGIGRVTAILFALEGARVVLADIDAAGLDETQRLIEETGGQARGVPADVAHAEDVAAIVREAVDWTGRLDCAFNNAGIGGTFAPTAEYPIDDWHRVIAVNLTGVWLCLRAELAQMVQQGTGGAIVNMASAAGLVGLPRGSAYTASKHGVIGLTRAAALEYAASSLRYKNSHP